MSTPRKTATFAKKGKAADPVLDFPSPMAPQYLNRSLVHPWRRKNEVTPAAAETPSTVLWTHLEQNMFELQVTAAENATHAKHGDTVLDPYPQ
jgi:hypothetical protein